MGIAALILGILSFLISFSWFQDLALILGVLGLVLGIIAIVKKKGKGQGIAGVILSVLAIIIMFSSGDTKTTGTGITTDTGSGTKRVSVSTDNIQMEKVGITKAGDFVIKVTNNNEGAVCLSSIVTVYKDKDDNFMEKVEAQDSFVCIPGKSSTLVYNWGFEKKFSKYPKYEFSCELANISEDFLYSDINITSKNTGKQIAVTAKNNSEETINDIKVVVAYYNKGKLVGIERGYADETVKSKSSAYINVDYPDDSNYNDVAFDKYEVYYISAGIN